MPRSKSASAAPLTTPARWNTASTSPRPSRTDRSLMTDRTRSDAVRSAGDAARSTRISSPTGAATPPPSEIGAASSLRASSEPRKPPPPVMTTRVLIHLIIQWPGTSPPVEACRSLRSRTGTLGHVEDAHRVAERVGQYRAPADLDLERVADHAAAAAPRGHGREHVLD